MSEFKYNPYSPINPPALNGGLFTGTPFMKDAPWANIPVEPTWSYMTNQNLRSANPPIGGLFQMPVNYRPGNNSDRLMPGVQDFIGNSSFGPFNFKCLPCFQKIKEIDNTNCKEIILPII